MKTCRIASGRLEKKSKITLKVRSVNTGTRLCSTTMVKLEFEAVQAETCTLCAASGHMKFLIELMMI